ncbi:RBBP9/YdeN family alpha/beta hydrolase [Kineococcus sp. SYSU DK003]|uniref:RBBP9/YdeN family alpha/beta hydrolase n=1 Tax=Kineococcus sp. SYSU DK003 TaxID=3383124 RepID=UPI003D7D70D8
MSRYPAPRELLLLDGWQHRRAEPGHWQGWLAQAATDAGWTVSHPTLPHPENPSLAAWRETVASRLTPGCTVVAHGLSALAWLRFAAQGPAGPRAGRVLLVAPPAPGDHGGDGGDGGDIARPLPAAVDPAAVRALSREVPLLVFAPDDPWTRPDAGALYGERLELPSIVVPGGGHLNAAAGFGPWPAALHWLTEGCWPDATASPAQALTAAHRPSGRRLGIAVAGDLPDDLLSRAADLLTVTGHRPLRRLATIRPRYGETRTRPKDVTAFVHRYGHEYTVVVVPEELDSGSLRDVCRSEGCGLVTTGPASRR